VNATPCREVVVLVALLVAATTDSADGPAPVVLTDATGQTVRLERPPQRIVILGDASYVIAHLLYMFPEGRQRLVGMERKGRSASDFLPLLDPTFSSRAFLSHGAGPEQLAGLHPDLALVRSSTLDRRAATLATVGIPLVHLGLESPERYPEDLRLLGLLLGNPARAEEVADYYRGRLAAVSAPLSAAPDAERPRVLLAMAMPRGGSVAVQVPARPWMQSRQVSLAGGRPVWLDEASPTSGWTVVNLEQIAAWDPDVILVVFWHSLDPLRGLEQLRADRHWSALRAVSAGRLHAFPADLHGWDTPDPRWVLGLLWTAKRLHPTRYAGLDLDAEVDRFYHLLYGMDKAAVDAAVRPSIRVDLK
jgi:iron complex transport system substrate-binding protein